MVRQKSSRIRPASYIKLVADTERPAGDALDFLSTELRNDRAPLGDGGGTDIERPRDIRGTLKVINNVLLEHAPILTELKFAAQPHSSFPRVTSAAMDKYATLKERLEAAMGDKIIATELARACGVSDAAVSKWLDGTTKKLSADNYAAAARALGVRDEWLRTGRLPMERENASEDRQIDQVIDILTELQEPLSALTAAIEKLSQSRPQTGRKRAKA